VDSTQRCCPATAVSFRALAALSAGAGRVTPPQLSLSSLTAEGLFLEPEAAQGWREFPQAANDAWTQYKHANENKLGMARRELFPAMTGAVTDELNSREFVEVE
jgi:hypothetical protein